MTESPCDGSGKGARPSVQRPHPEAWSFAKEHSPAPHGLRVGPMAWSLEPPHLPKVRG